VSFIAMNFKIKIFKVPELLDRLLTNELIVWS